MQEAGDKLSAADRAPIESAAAEVRKALEAEDDGALEAAMKKLTEVQHKAAEAMYKQAGDTPPAPGPSSAGPGGGDAPSGGAAEGEVIDAEVVEDKK